MREIKFRGRAKDKWEYGYLMQTDTLHCGSVFWTSDHSGEVDEIVEVDSNTIGQYTALKDKNGKEIYEGDIVKEIIRTPNGQSEYIGVVKYRKGCFVIQGKRYFSLLGVAGELEVIGNIYENPELFEEDKNERD